MTSVPAPDADPVAPRVPDRAPDPSLAQAFTHFARHDAGLEPLYARLAEAAAADPRRVAPLEAAAPSLRKPVLWFAAIHDRLMALAESGDTPAPALAAYYPSLGGLRAPDDALPAALDAFLVAERAALRETIATRTTQTNEIARCAVLAPLLADLSARNGGRPLALLDVGCSAGLNLGVDRYGYRYLDPLTRDVAPGWPASPGVEGRRRPDDLEADDEVAVIGTVQVGETPPPAGPFRITHRAGVDIAPIDPDDARAVRWLRACLWPADAARRQRLDAALALARRERWPLRRTDDAAAAIGEWLDALPADVLPVVFNSWVLFYFDADAFARHVRAVLGHVARGRATWISAEEPARMRLAWPDLPEPDAAAIAAAARAGVSARELAATTAWTVAEPARDAATGAPTGAVAWRLGARSHAHARWVQFTGDEAGAA